MNLFSINAEDGTLVISNPEILADEVFNKLYQRDKKLLIFVWWVADNRSPLKTKGYTLEVKIEKACIKLGINIASIDSDVRTAIVEYEELNSKLESDALNVVQIGLQTSISLIRQTIEVLNKTAIVEFDDTKLKQIGYHLSNLKDTSRDIIKNINELKIAQKNFDAVETDSVKRAGGHAVPPSAVTQ